MKNTTKANLSLLIVMLLMIFGPLTLRHTTQVVNSILPEYIFILIPCLIIIFIRKKSIVETLRLHKINFNSIVIVILIAIMMRPFIGVVSYVASQFVGDQISEFVGNETIKLTSLQLLFSLAITPAICEEVMLRGIVLDGYKNVSFKKAIILNGILFGIFHMNYHQFSYTFFMGIILAASVYITNSIYAGMLIHFINNGIDVLLVTLNKNTTTDVMKTASESLNTNQLIAMVVFAGISIFILVKLFKKLIKYNVGNMVRLEGDMVVEEKVLNWSLIVLIIVFLSISTLVMYSSKLA